MSSSDDGAGAIALFAFLLLGLAVFLAVGLVWAIVVMVAAAAAREARRRYLTQRAGEEYDHTVAEQGLTLPVDDSLDMLFAGGLDFKPSGGLDNIDVLVYATGGSEADT